MSKKKTPGKWEFEEEVAFEKSNHVQRVYRTDGSAAAIRSLLRTQRGEGIAEGSTNSANVWFTVKATNSKGKTVWLSTYARAADQAGVEDLMMDDLDGLSGDYDIENLEVILVKVSIPE